MKTLILQPRHFELSNLPKDVRHEINRATREGLEFREIDWQEHEKHLKEYRKRKNLLMPRWPTGKAERRFFGAYTKAGEYTCSIALYESTDRLLVIQSASISADCPYYGFSFLIYRCLGLSLKEGFKGLDLAGQGLWKLKWQPTEFDNFFPEPKSLTHGKFEGVLGRIYWFKEAAKQKIGMH